MGLLNLNFRDGSFLPALDPSHSMATSLGDAARNIAPGSPVVVLLHGFRYDPDVPCANPHTLLYANQTDPKLPKRQKSWPTALGFRGLYEDPGLCIALGWPARGRLADAYDRAGQVGLALADLLTALAALLPGHPIKLLAHSLGARVALCCLNALNAPHVAQAILLAPAEFKSVAERMLANPATQNTEILQISPKENRLFDTILVHSLRRKACGTALGQSPPAAPNWLSLNLDTASELKQLASLGHAVSPRGAPICHWSAYLRGGLMELYTELLIGPNRRSFRSVAESGVIPSALAAE